MSWFKNLMDSYVGRDGSTKRKKSKFKTRYERPEIDDLPTYNYEYYGDDAAGGSWGGTHQYYKPKFDMSVSLETRVGQLIKGITGKELKLARAYGWGSDDKYFYYNPIDLTNATDDEVLGRILQQLAKELYVDKEALAKLQKDEPVYKELIETLESNRSDRQLQERYGGAAYYSQGLWEVRKFKENPINQYEDTSFVGCLKSSYLEWDSTEEQCMSWFNGLAKKDQQAVEIHYKQWFEQRKDLGENPAWEFCFNIHALQNKEKVFDFSQDAMADNFTKALPAIDAYLNAASFEEALKHYREVKKYYPLPNQQQQEQMNKGMQGMQGLSAADMKQGRANAEAEAKAIRNALNGQDPLEALLGRQAGLAESAIELRRDLAFYHQIKNEQMPVINTLKAYISSILKDNAIKRYMRPFKRGKIDGKRMYKFIATENLRIFKKPKAISQKDYAMAIVIDQSGSMVGARAEHSLRTAITLIEVFEALGLDYAVMGFNGYALTYKKFGQQLNRAIIPTLGVANGGTYAVSALASLEHQMNSMGFNNNSPKGLFFITDGEDGDPEAIQSLTDKVGRLYNAKVFGIGIGDGIDEDDLKHSFKNYLHVQDVKALPKELTNLIKGQFKRG